MRCLTFILYLFLSITFSMTHSKPLKREVTNWGRSGTRLSVPAIPIRALTGPLLPPLLSCDESTSFVSAMVERKLRFTHRYITMQIVKTLPLIISREEEYIFLVSQHFPVHFGFKVNKAAGKHLQ